MTSPTEWNTLYPKVWSCRCQHVPKCNILGYEGRLCFQPPVLLRAPSGVGQQPRPCAAQPFAAHLFGHLPKNLSLSRSPPRNPLLTRSRPLIQTLQNSLPQEGGLLSPQACRGHEKRHWELPSELPALWAHRWLDADQTSYNEQTGRKKPFAETVFVTLGVGVGEGFDAGVTSGAGFSSSSPLESSHESFTSAADGAFSSSGASQSSGISWATFPTAVGSGSGVSMGSGVSSFGGGGSGVWGTDSGAGEPLLVGPAFLRLPYTGRFEGAAGCCNPSICAPDASKACLRISAARCSSFCL